MRMDFIYKIYESFEDCFVDICKKRGCKLHIASIKHFALILDCDKYQEKLNIQEEICDYIIFARPKISLIVIGVVELKSGRADVEKACNQIKKGAQIAEEITQGIKKAHLFPILVHTGHLKHHGKSINSMQAKEITKERIIFKGKNYIIYLEESGGSFCRILQESGLLS